MASTLELITQTRFRIGEDTAATSRVTDAQIVYLLNEAQRKICTDSEILLSSWTTSTVASQERYNVPSDYIRVVAVFLNRGTSGSNLKLTPMDVRLRDPQANTGTPNSYYVWGANLSGVNAFVLGLQPVPTSSGTNDLQLYAKQLPLTMVSGGQAPEIHTSFQDALPAYAEWMVHKRRGRDWRMQALDAKAEWDEWLRKAKAWRNPLMTDFPTGHTDTAGLLSTSYE